MRKTMTQIGWLAALLVLHACQGKKPSSGSADFLINGRDLPKFGEEYLGNPKDLDGNKVFQADTSTQLTFVFKSKQANRPTTIWNFGDGTEITGDSVVYRYMKPGRYEVVCIGESPTVSISKLVYAAALPAPPPTPPPAPTPVVEPCSKPPIAKCKKSIKRLIPLSGSAVYVSLEDIDNGSVSPCESPLQRNISQSSFNKVGKFSVTLNVTDLQGSSTCATSVEVAQVTEPPCPALPNTKLVTLNQNRDAACIALKGGGISISIKPKQCIGLRSAAVWSNMCGRLAVSIKGSGIDADDVVVLTEGQNTIPLQELYATLRAGKTYTLTLRPVQDNACGSQTPLLEDFSACGQKVYSDDYINLQQNGGSILFNLKYTY
jgi:hypothetical protein